MFLVGKIVGTFGNKGEVKIQPLINPKDYLLEMETFYVEGDDGTKQGFKVLTGRVHKNVFVFHLENVNDMNVAEGLIDYAVYVPSIEVKELQENEFYYHQLQGMSVFSESGEEIGKVDHVMQSGSDILVIKDDNGNEIMIPFVDELVPEVNLEQKTITVNMIEGLAGTNDKI